MYILNHFLDGLGLASGIKNNNITFRGQDWFHFLRLKVRLIPTQLNLLCKPIRNLHRLSTASPIGTN
jgi:hypothetical protein